MIICKMVLIVRGEFLRMDWHWLETFDDFLKEAIQLHPEVEKISLDWGGDEISMHQGDLEYGVWEKHNGKWYKMEYTTYHFYDRDKLYIPYPELDDLK